MHSNAHTLVKQGTRVHRCISTGNGYAKLIKNGACETVSLSRIKTIPVVHSYQSSFDEWTNVPDTIKRHRIRDAIAHNPQLCWQAGAADTIARNLPVFDHCVVETCLLVRKGVTHYACRTILEVARHKTYIAMIEGDYKINNNLIPDIARLLIAIFPEVPEGFFQLRHGRRNSGVAA